MTQRFVIYEKIRLICEGFIRAIYFCSYPSIRTKEAASTQNNEIYSLHHSLNSVSEIRDKVDIESVGHVSTRVIVFILCDTDPDVLLCSGQDGFGVLPLRSLIG
jgi:hypothetical protein